jgi:hypothetical protein
MKRKNISLLVLPFALCSCSKEVPSYIEYINKYDIYIYCLLGSYKNDDYDLSDKIKITAIDSFDSLLASDTVSFHLVVIDCDKYYSRLDSAEIQDVYDYLADFSRKTVVDFYDAKDYDFFRGTSFANEKNYYGDTVLYNSYSNLDGSIVNIESTTNITGFRGQLAAFSTILQEYNGSL